MRGVTCCTSSRLRAMRGLTLVEILVVITIIAVLLAVLLPAVMDARKAADRLRCAGHLKQIELGTLTFHATFNAFPAYFKPIDTAPNSSPLLQYYSVFSHIAPQLDQVSLFNQINFQGELVDDSVASQIPQPESELSIPC